MTPVKVEYKPEPYNKVKLTLAKAETRIKVGVHTDPELVKRLEAFAEAARVSYGFKLTGTLRGKVVVDAGPLRCALYYTSRSGPVYAGTVLENGLVVDATCGLY